MKTDADVIMEDCYQTYPHANGFADGGRSLVLGRVEGKMTSLWKVPLDGGAAVKVCEFDTTAEAEPLLWFDVALTANRLFTVAQGALWSFDLNLPSSAGEMICRPPLAISYGLCSVTADGARVVLPLRDGEFFVAYEIDTATGRGRELFRKDWWVGHLHYCPHDESWIGFCHEGKCEVTADRVWGWHQTLAPEGRCLFDQRWEDAERRLFTGHERWCFHQTGALTVAYGVSDGKPRGVYEVTPGNPAGRLVSEGDRHLHVSPSHCGRWAVIDTCGPHDMPGRGWENAGTVSDIILLDMADGRQQWLTRSRLSSHPWHVHPVFSPDGKSVFFNEAAAQGRGGRVMRIANPWFIE